MKKFFLLVLAWFIVLFIPANAQVPQGFVGMNYGGDPTITVGFPYATGVVPYYTTFDRIYDSIRGSTAHSTWWSTLNPSAGVYTFAANLDPILTTEAARGKKTEYTLSGVPAYVSGTQKVVGSTQLTQFSTFLTAMMSHVASNGQCFGYFSLWNEVNQPSTYWVGTPADLAALSAVAYPIIKSNCPKTVVLTPSITSGIDTGSSPNPNDSFQYFNTYVAACLSNCFDALNIHGYPLPPSLQTANASISLAPELIVNNITNAKAVGSANGLSLPLYIDEGYAVSDPASTVFPANTVAYAQAQAVQLVLAASAGVVSYANSFFGAGCTIPACGNEYISSGPLKLTYGGLAKRQISAWLAGTTFTSPIARTQGTNLIIAPNGAGVATGSLGGTGVGCSSPPAGTGSLPTGWALSATASISGGMSYYVVGSGAVGGLPYIDVRMCGTDASGANSDSIRMNNFTGAATVGQNATLAACIGVSAGSLTGIQETDYQINEYKAGPVYNNQFMVQTQVHPVPTVSVASQCYQTRYAITASDTTIAEPYYLLKHYGSTAIDVTFRLANPHLDINSTRWSGTISKAGGYAATIVFDPAGGNFTAPGGSVDWRDIFGGVHTTSGGATIALTAGSPILVESIRPVSYVPRHTTILPGFFVNPSAGGSDSFAGTIAAPFATLNKCHTAMQGSSIKICYVRGAVNAANWAQGNNETWSYYPNDAKYAATITISGNTVQNIGCTNCHDVSVYGLTIIGTGVSSGSTASLFGYYTITNVFVQDVHVSTTSTEQIASIFNWNNVRFQGNTYISPPMNGLDQLSVVVNDGAAHSGLYITDSTFTNLARIQLEILDLGAVSAEPLTNVHVDRNIFNGTIDNGAIEAITFAGSGLSAAVENTNTMYGNTITFPSNSNNNVSGIEHAMSGATISFNEIDYTAFALSFGTVPGTAAFSNTIKIPLSNTVAHNAGPASWSAGGTYNQSEWIGSNTIVGSGGTNTVSGCSGLAFPPVSPGYCAILSPPIYGAPPVFYPPSPVWNQ